MLLDKLVSHWAIETISLYMLKLPDNSKIKEQKLKIKCQLAKLSSFHDLFDFFFFGGVGGGGGEIITCKKVYIGYITTASFRGRGN